MMTVLKIKPPLPTVEPLTRDEIKNHCRIDSAEDDIYLDTLLVVARDFVEKLCGPMINQTWEQYEDDWPCRDYIRIGKPRVQSSGFSLIYTDVNNLSTTLSTAYYSVDSTNEWFPSVVLNYGYAWPLATLHPVNPIKITFTCGYGTTADTVPSALKQAMLLLIGHLYEERQPVNVSISGNSVVPMPYTIEALLANYRAW